MLQQEISDIIRRKIQEKFFDLNRRLQQDIERILAEAAQRGMASSGPTLASIEDRYIEEMNERSNVVWQGILEIIKSVGVPFSEDLSADLKAEVNQNLWPVVGILNPLLWRKVDDMGLADSVFGREIKQKNILWDVAARAEKRIETEIDVYILSLKNQGKAGSPSRTASQLTRESSIMNSPKVFVVHGRNEGYRETIARFLERLKLRPVILHEQPNKGRTIIEKFMDYADVAFAVILLTADDHGGLASESFENQKLRARQNVIFELGFFLGRLGRDRVCALYEDGVEIPSDYNGVVFIPLDRAEAWRIRLARELRAANLSTDMNDVV
jgi:predicted nucleotide-binding protein